MWQYNYNFSAIGGNNYIAHADWKKHKYLLKKKIKGKWRYFYNNSNVKKYKEALSSKDEEAAYLKAIGAKSLEEAKYLLELAKHNSSDGLSGVDKLNWEVRFKDQDIRNAALAAESEYKRAKTLGGKVEDVKDVSYNKNVKPYLNALTSKDEKKKYLEVTGKHNIAGADMSRLSADIPTITVYPDGRAAQLSQNMNPYTQHEKDMIKAQKDYYDARTVGGKVQDVKDVYSAEKKEKEKKKKYKTDVKIP